MSTEALKTDLALRDAAPAPSWIQKSSEELGNAGLEHVRVQDIEIPRLALMQALSPEVANEGKFKAGDIVDSINQELIAESGKPIKIIVLKHFLQWIKWKPRDAGGGLVDSSLDGGGALAKEYGSQDLSKLDAKKDEVVIEYHNFVVILPEVNPERMFMISCGKTNWKHGKNLISRMKMRGNRLPAFAGVYTVKSDNETNKSNQTYKVFKFDNAGWCDEKMFEFAKRGYETIREKTVTAKVDSKDGDAGSGEFKETEL